MPQQHAIDPRRPVNPRAVRRWINGGYYDRPEVISTALDSDGVMRLIDEVFAVPDADESASVEQALWDEKHDGERFE